MANYKLADSVLHRIVQIVQEAMLTGTDCSDYFRQIDLVPDESSTGYLVLTTEYKQHVKDSHAKLLEQVEELQTKRSPSLILDTDGTNS